MAIKGPITTPIGKGFKSVNVTLRQNLDLYVNLRPVKSFKGIKSRYEDIDLVIVRENTEGLYSGIEHKIGDYGAETIKIITKPACERICEFAFNYAKDNNRKKVTGVHKANIMKLSDGLFLNTFRDIASKYPDIKSDDLIVDAACIYTNVSTAFTDGAQFGLGAEIGISTQKLHARGPMGLEEMTSYKWVIEGNGQTRW